MAKEVWGGDNKVMTKVEVVMGTHQGLLHGWLRGSSGAEVAEVLNRELENLKEAVIAKGDGGLPVLGQGAVRGGVVGL